jgi:hypothetical protein
MNADEKTKNLYHRGHEGTQRRKNAYRGFTRMNADEKPKPFTTEDTKEHGGGKNLPRIYTDERG